MVQLLEGSALSIGRGSLRRLMQRRSTIAFLMTLPLLTLMIGLVAYPAGFAIWLSMLDRSMGRFVGLDNFAYLLGRERFWMTLYQTCLFAVTAVALKAFLGFVAAHLVHNLPAKGQRKWRGMLLVPWVIPAAMSVLGWRLLSSRRSAPSTGSSSNSAWTASSGWARPAGRAFQSCWSRCGLARRSSW